MYSRRDGKKIRKTFPSYREARSWRNSRLEWAATSRPQVAARITLAEVSHSWIEKARNTEIRNRSGRPYKPSALRTLEQAFRLRLIPELGSHPMGKITGADLQRCIGKWSAAGMSPSSVRRTLNAARVLWRDLDLITGVDNQVAVNPTRGLRLPAGESRRERVATRDEAFRLIEALPESDQALWETAITAGLRLGELRALRVEDIDFAHKRINVTRGWDAREGEIDVKSERGRRSTVITARLEQRLGAHLVRTGAKGADLIFGRDAYTPFDGSTVRRRAQRVWQAARER